MLFRSGKIAETRDRIVHERGREKLAVAIVDHSLQKGLPRALGVAAVELVLGDQRVDDRPRVVDPDAPG